MTSERTIGSPSYPPRHTLRDVTAWATHHLNAYKPALPAGALTTGERRPVADVDFRRRMRTVVADDLHRRQLAAWCTAKANPRDRDLSFAAACSRFGWPEKTAERNVDRALTALVLAFNLDA